MILIKICSKIADRKIFIFFILFHIKITASVTKNSHQDRGLCYLHLRFFSYTCTLHFCWKIKRCCDRCFLQQIRQHTTVQLYILRNVSSVMIGFNMINKRRILPITHHISLTRWLPTTNILIVIGRIYRYQFKYNYLENQKDFAAILLDFWNLHQILNFLKTRWAS